MILATQAAAEYAALAMERAASVLGSQWAEARDFAGENTVFLLVIVLGLVVIYSLRPGRDR